MISDAVYAISFRKWLYSQVTPTWFLSKRMEAQVLYFP